MSKAHRERGLIKLIRISLGAQPTAATAARGLVRPRPGENRSEIAPRTVMRAAPPDFEFQFDFEGLAEGVFSRISATIGMSRQVGVGVG
jgi:hypothetical protein